MIISLRVFKVAAACQCQVSHWSDTTDTTEEVQCCLSLVTVDQTPTSATVVTWPDLEVLTLSTRLKSGHPCKHHCHQPRAVPSQTRRCDVPPVQSYTRHRCNHTLPTGPHALENVSMQTHLGHYSAMPMIILSHCTIKCA